MELSDKDLAVYIGKKIKEFRKSKKFTQRDLGRLINKSDNTISNYETGTIAPSQDALFSIANALDVRVDDLFPPRNDRTSSLQSAIQISEEINMDIEDLNFLNKLIDHALTLDGDERKRFINNIKLAVEFFNKSNE